MVGPGLAVDLGESIARLANVRFGSLADIARLVWNEGDRQQRRPKQEALAGYQG